MQAVYSLWHLRIICDREDEINAFIPEEYWSLDGEFQCKRREKAIGQPEFYGTDKQTARSIIQSGDGSDPEEALEGQ